MGILYNRFTPESSPTSWILIKKFTEVGSFIPIGDLTGKTELLVVCNDIVSLLFCIHERGTSSPTSEDRQGEKKYNTISGTGYRFDVFLRQHDQNPSLYVSGVEYTSSSSGQSLSSVNTKVFVR